MARLRQAISPDQAAATPLGLRIRLPSGWQWSALLFLIGFCLTFRMVLLHRAAYSPGENGDGIIVIATLEHWYHVFQGSSQDWRTTGFFYPTQGTLGLTDTFFLYGVPYAGARGLGFGPFASFTAAVALFSAVGYWGMYALCRRWLAAAPLFAAAGAYIFAFGAMPVWKLIHVQTYTIMLAPLIFLLLLAVWRTPLPSVRVVLGGVTGLLCGLIVLSSAQTAWFLCFVMALAVPAWLLLERPQPSAVALRRTAPAAAGIVVGLVVASLPVLMVYLPRAAQSTRDFAEVLAYSPRPADLIHVPPGTPVWSDLLHAAGLSADSGVPVSELALGYTPGFLLLVLAAAAGLAISGRRSGGRTALDNAAVACVVAALLAWAVQLGFSGRHWHPWAIVFDWVPGARAIRTPFRVQLAAQFLMCLAFAHLLTRHAAAAVQAIRAPRADAAKIGRAATILLLLGMGVGISLAEQVGPGPLVRHNPELASWLSTARRPPFPCQAFYLIADPASPQTFWERQSDAMLLSQWLNLPTLNGSSSWMPPGWDLMHPEAPEYAQKLHQWITMNNLEGRVCGADPRAGRWQPGSAALPG